ncbi:MAG: hypothetical protein HY674_01175 [Chloroflexi bacterium]|nr:hypothetical protein [Chloroflexota bacterium]
MRGETAGSPFSVEGFGSASAQQIKVKYNPTNQDFSGANSQTITIGGITGQLTSGPNSVSVSVTGLSVVVADVLNISGSFGFSKQSIDHDRNPTTPPLAKVTAVASDVEARITAGSFAVDVTQASLGLVMETVPNTATPDPNDTVSQMTLRVRPSSPTRSPRLNRLRAPCKRPARSCSKSKDSPP